MSALDQRVVQLGGVLLAALLLVMSWQRGFRQTVDRMAQDQRRVAVLTDQLARWQAAFQSAGGQAAWMARAQRQLAQQAGKFPQQAQVPQVLNTLVEAFKDGETKLVNVGQGNLEPVQDEGVALRFDGVPCYRLPITVEVEGRYHAIRQALERLTGEAFPAVVSIGRVELRLKDAANLQLQATIRLVVYVIGTTPS